MGYELEHLPEKVKNKLQDISLKFSPQDFDVELITSFSINKTFQEALESSERIMINNEELLKTNVLDLSDLINSKIKAGRLRDLLDVQQLKEINKIE